VPLWFYKNTIESFTNLAAMKISFFKTAKPKDFSYRPLYYDERKEELEKIKKSVEAESGDDVAERMRVRLDRSWRDKYDRRRRRSSTSNLRLLIYLAAIVMVIYFMFFAKIF
jgi:hypothetical protein